ncbi:MAG: YfdX family protein [Steroidobacteraceae bacterium]
MKLNKLNPLSVAALMPLFIVSACTRAADTAPSAPPRAEQKALQQFSAAGNTAMMDVRSARFAIFNGQPDIAIKLIASAKDALVRADKDAPTLTTTTKMMVGGKTIGTTTQTGDVKRVPFDGQLLLADNFVATPEKAAHISKANEHLRNGDHAKALEELRLGEIDVNYTRFWIPITASQKHLEQAAKLAGDGKFYEANLALKAIEDSVTADSISLSELPKAAK